MSQPQKSQPVIAVQRFDDRGAIRLERGGVADTTYGGVVTFHRQPGLRAERVEVEVGLRGRPGMVGGEVRPVVIAVRVEGIDTGVTVARWWRAFPAKRVETVAVAALTSRTYADGRVVEPLLGEVGDGAAVAAMLDRDRTGERAKRVPPAEVLELAEEAERRGQRPAAYIALKMGCSETAARQRLSRARRRRSGDGSR